MIRIQFSLTTNNLVKTPPHNPKDKRWLQWRADILTEFLARLYQQVKAVNPNLIVSVAPNIYDWAFKEYLQDSVTWFSNSKFKNLG